MISLEKRPIKKKKKKHEICTCCNLQGLVVVFLVGFCQHYLTRNVHVHTQNKKNSMKGLVHIVCRRSRYVLWPSFMRLCKKKKGMKGHHCLHKPLEYYSGPTSNKDILSPNSTRSRSPSLYTRTPSLEKPKSANPAAPKEWCWTRCKIKSTRILP